MEFVEKNLENMKQDLKELVSFNSEEAADAKPFGLNNRKVLDAALRQLKDKGFREVKNLDYYCGYGEVGEGDQTIGIVCHLDVVPCSDGWLTDPFEMAEKDGFLFGRGVSDDKGPAVAAQYAIKYLLDTGYPFKKKVRLILGCAEETGSECMRYYVSKEGHVDMGFTPDGSFPGIYAEKGMVSGDLIGPSKILSIHGGDATNIVCKRVECVVPASSFDEEKFKEFLDEKKISYQISSCEEGTKLTVEGQAAHASLPDNGVNAISHLMEALYLSDFDDEYVTLYHNCIGLSVHGEKMGFEDLKDEATDTSINMGVISMNEGKIVCTLDMRFPIQTSSEKCLALLSKMNSENCHFVKRNSIEPLYFDREQPMIRALKSAYVKVTGDETSEMEAIGGGTYAKSMKNIIAFGAEFAGYDAHMHDANECLKIEDFKKQVEIYIEAIKNLNEA